MKPLIIFVHGAGASPLSFRWLQEQLPDHDCIAHHYSTHHSVMDVVSELSTLLNGHGRPVTVIGHSLGGIIAARIIGHPLVSKIVTISSPLGGMIAATAASWFSSQPMFRDLSPYSPVIRHIKQSYPHEKPHLAIVTTSGLPILNEANDGVVMVSSQISLTGPRYERINLNHFEVLLSDETSILVKDFLNEPIRRDE